MRAADSCMVLSRAATACGDGSGTSLAICKAIGGSLKIGCHLTGTGNTSVCGAGSLPPILDAVQSVMQNVSHSNHGVDMSFRNNCRYVIDYWEGLDWI